MRLFYTPGTSSLFPHIVLQEAGLTFEKTRVDEHTKVMEDGRYYTTVNPLGFVPALELDDGPLLTEGVAIAQYIADRVPAKQLAPPNGTLARTRLQLWLNFVAAEIHVACFCPLFHSTTSEPARSMYRERLASRLNHIDRHLIQNRWTVGENTRLRTHTCTSSQIGRAPPRSI